MKEGRKWQSKEDDWSRVDRVTLPGPTYHADDMPVEWHEPRQGEWEDEKKFRYGREKGEGKERKE